MTRRDASSTTCRAPRRPVRRPDARLLETTSSSRSPACASDPPGRSPKGGFPWISRPDGPACAPRVPWRTSASWRSWPAPAGRDARLLRRLAAATARTVRSGGERARRLRDGRRHLHGRSGDRRDDRDRHRPGDRRRARLLARRHARRLRAQGRRRRRARGAVRRARGRHRARPDHARAARNGAESSRVGASRPTAVRSSRRPLADGTHDHARGVERREQPADVSTSGIASGRDRVPAADGAEILFVRSRPVRRRGACTRSIPPPVMSGRSSRRRCRPRSSAVPRGLRTGRGSPTASSIPADAG